MDIISTGLAADFATVERELPPVTGADPTSRHRRGKAFENICLWLLLHDPVLAADVRRAWLWDNWPDRSGADHGIDIVVDAYDGLWAVQCKADHPDRAVTKREIDSFLAAAGPRFARRILFSTSNLVAPNANRALRDHSVIVYGRSALQDADVDWDSYRTGTAAQKHVSHSPRPHQAIAIAKTSEALRTGGRSQAVMPCGTGKTLIAQRVAEELQTQNVVVVVPTLGLLAQTLRSWAANTNRVYHALAVCSDDAVTIDDAETLAPYEIPAARTADPQVIKDFLSDTEEPRVIFATYQSAARLLHQAQALGAKSIELLIADEAHRLVGGGAFAGVLDDSKVLADRRLLLTATPRIFDASSRAGEDLRILSMDNEDLYGPVSFKMSFSDAIKNDLLADYEVIVLLVDDTTAARLVQQGRGLQIDGMAEPDAPARDVACAAALVNGATRYGFRTAVTFHSTVKGVQRFPQLLTFAARHTGLAHNEIWARSITGKDPARQRAQLLKELTCGQRTLNVISNARCLAEGIDVPALDAVVFVDPRYSQVDIIQAIGRAIRRHPSKGTGKIVIPVPVSSASAHGEIERTEFHAVYRVLRALRAHDESLAEQLDTSRARHVAGGSYCLPTRVTLDVSLLPDALASGFLNAFQPILLEETADAWVVRYQHLCRWVAENDSVALTKRLSTMPENLKRWVSKQRANFNSRSIPTERVDLLEEVPGWAWDADDAEWERNLQATLGFYQQNGHLPKDREAVFAERRVGSWLAKQRAAGRRDDLSPERQARLEQLPGFEPFHRDNRFWRPVAAYQKWAADQSPEQLNRGPRSGDVIDGVDLAAWIDNIRLRRRRKQDEGRDLPQWQLAALDELPCWRWSSDRADREQADFARRVEVIRAYCNQTGRRPSEVAQSFIWDDEPIGRWISIWRWSRDNLPAHRRTLLETLPGWSWTLNSDDELWGANLTALAEFGRRYGHLKPSIKAPQEEGAKELGVWKRNNKNRLRAERSDRARRFFALLAEYGEGQ